MEHTIGKRIAAHRKRLGMTQEQLAEKLGITAQAVSKWENDQSCPDISVLPVLADIFQISTDALLGRVQMPVVVDAAQSQQDHASCYTEEDEDCDVDEDEDDEEDDDDDEPTFSVKADWDSDGDGGKRYLFGTAALFLVVGILFLLSKVLDWECSLWDIIWPSTLLVYGITGLIGHISLTWLACSAVGAFFLVDKIFPLPIELDNGILWAVIIIICGIMILLDALRKKHHFKFKVNDDRHSCEYRVADNFLHCSNSFGEMNQTVVADRLIGGKISNSFGEYTVNLSEVEEVSNNCKIEASCSFGKLTLLVPKRYAVVHKSSKSFASFSAEGSPDDCVAGQIFLDASVNFGEITVEYI